MRKFFFKLTRRLKYWAQSALYRLQGRDTIDLRMRYFIDMEDYNPGKQFESVFEHISREIYDASLARPSYPHKMIFPHYLRSATGSSWIPEPNMEVLQWMVDNNVVYSIRADTSMPFEEYKDFIVIPYLEFEREEDLLLFKLTWGGDA